MSEGPRIYFIQGYSIWKDEIAFILPCICDVFFLTIVPFIQSIILQYRRQDTVMTPGVEGKDYGPLDDLVPALLVCRDFLVSKTSRV